MTALSTSVAINGDRVSLAFGSRFDVRYGKDDKVLRDALLFERAKNGDLVFDAGTGTMTMKVRVRPSTIDSIVGSADRANREAAVLDGEPAPDYSAPSVISPRSPGETASDYLRRIERGLGSGGYARWIGSDAGQRALEDVAKEDRAARKAPRLKDVVVDPPKGPFPTLDATEEAYLRSEEAGPVDATPPATLVEKTKATGRPYAERNQVWRCGTCKRRTRVPICVGPADQAHEPVSAPAGKRRDDR